MKLGNTTPILRIFDEAKARDGCVLHLSEHHGDACPGAALRIETSTTPSATG